MVEITQKNFWAEFRKFHASDGGGKDVPSASFVMIRPHRPFDHEAHQYPDKAAKEAGDEAMKAWGEYLAAKWLVQTFNAWRGLLKDGHSIMVVCADPCDFDRQYVKPKYPPLPPDFWAAFERSRIPLDRWHDAAHTEGGGQI